MSDAVVEVRTEKEIQEKMAITLNSGFKMPIIGLGVWRMEGQAIKDLIINSIKIGYRHFDCAGIVFLLLQIWKLFYLDFNLVF